MILYFVSGLSLGFIGSMHCIGMCGPLALALPAHTISFKKAWVGRVLYNLGRILVYVLLGVFIFFLGEISFLHTFQNKYSSILSIILFLSLSIFIVSKLNNSKISKPANQKEIGKINKFKLWKTKFSHLIPLRKWIHLLYQKKTYSSFLLLGVLNGLLPCSFVYSALTAAILSKTLFGTMLFMFSFGLGTFPAMMAISLGQNIFSKNLQMYLIKWQPVFIILAALSLALRGIESESNTWFDALSNWHHYFHSDH